MEWFVLGLAAGTLLGAGAVLALTGLASKADEIARTTKGRESCES